MRSRIGTARGLIVVNETAPAQNHKASFGFVFAVLLIDMLGFGIVMPVMPGLIMHLAHVPLTTAAQYGGWLAAGYAAVQFICAPVIGNLSDRFGRRPVLLASILAMGIDYMILSIAPSFWWLAIGRLVAGMTGASYTAAYAYVADITPPEKRAASFGKMGMAFGLGFVIGPALGGLLGMIGPRAPFIAAGLLALGNFAFGAMFLKESMPKDNRRPFDWKRANAFSALRSLKGQSPAVLWFVAALGLWQLAHVVYPAVWSYFAMAAYHFNPKQVGIALAAVGLASALVQGFVMPKVLPKLGAQKAVALGVGGFCLSGLLYAVQGIPGMVWVAIAFGALQGLIQPSISSLNSRSVDRRNQGELQGAVQSVGSIAQIIGPPIYTETLARFSGHGAIIDLPAMPLLLAAVISLATLALFWRGASLAGPHISVTKGAGR